MATPRIKATYSLDVETVRALERTAKRWNVSKSEALRRAILSAAARDDSLPQDALASLEALQDALSIDDPAATQWEDAVRAERSASFGPRDGEPS